MGKKVTNEQKAIMHVVTSLTNPVRLSYAFLFQPVKDDSGKLKYQTQIIISKNDTETLQKISAAMKIAADVQWNGEVPDGARIPLRDGDKTGDGGVPKKYKAGEEPYGGNYFMNLKSDYAPEVVDQAMRKITDSGQIISGDYASVSMNCFAYDNDKGFGISFGLGNVQLVRKGEPLGSRISADKEFSPIPTDGKAVAGGDDSGEAKDPTRPFG